MAYELENVEDRARASDTFHIPNRASRDNLRPADMAKVVFKVNPPVDGCAGERMWVVVRGRSDDGGYVGALNNHPVSEGIGVSFGDEVRFGPEHICGIDVPSAQADDERSPDSLRKVGKLVGALAALTVDCAPPFKDIPSVFDDGQDDGLMGLVTPPPVGVESPLSRAEAEAQTWRTHALRLARERDKWWFYWHARLYHPVGDPLERDKNRQPIACKVCGATPPDAFPEDGG